MSPRGGARPPLNPALVDQVISDIQTDRRAWRLTEVPQLVTLTLLLIALASIATIGVAAAVTGLRDDGNALQLVKVMQIFVGGSSSLLGFVVVKLSRRISELTKRYITEQKRFTSELNRIRLCATPSEIDDLLKTYYK